MLEHLTSAMFRPHLNHTFTLWTDTTPYPLALISVTDLPQHGVASRRGPFSLVFRGPADVLLPQMIYRMTHPDMADLDIFLVPIGPDDGGMRYEAIFN